MRQFMLLIMFLVMAGPVWAQDGEPEAAPQPAPEQPAPEQAPEQAAPDQASPVFKKQQPQTPITKWMAAESAVVEKLDDGQKEHYFILRNKYGMIRAIRLVKQDIGNAIQQCGLANPDLQSTMNKRFTAWKGAVDPILKTADTYLEQEINEQTMVEKAVFEDMLELNDEAFDYQQSAIEKNVVTTPAACEKLILTMDKTEEDMLRLMQGILLPVNVISDNPQN